MEQSEYAKALQELEKIAQQVEDPSTALDDMDRYLKRSGELIEACRGYLRGVRETLDEKNNQ